MDSEDRVDPDQDVAQLDAALLDDKTPEHNAQEEKEREILEACKWRDLDALRALAESLGGFLRDELRQQAWPILMGLPSSDTEKPTSLSAEELSDSAVPWESLPRHRDEDQVRLDVDRAFVYYPDHRDEDELERQKQELSALIVEVLRRYPYLCYFQGYHDICQVILLVLPKATRTPVVARLSVLHIRDFMLPTLTAAIAQLRLLPDILRAADPALWAHLSATEPFFALSGTLTMYAHDVTTLGDIARLFDVLLAREPAFSLYVFAAIVLSRRAELFAVPRAEPEMLHSILSKLPRPLRLEALVADAAALFDACPPHRLPAWRRISNASALKTARGRDPARRAAQTMADGKRFFDRHVHEIHRADRRAALRSLLRRYRRPAGVIGLAVAVAVLAFWLRRSPDPWAYVSELLSRWWRW